jgi:CheY-like chemotaxis protein
MQNLHPRILVADPDVDDAELYAHMLGLTGREITHASDGRDALAKALASPFALVIAETHLPFIDGYSLCEILRKDRATRNVPIMVVTSDPRPVSLTRALQAGADATLVKPYAPDVFKAEVQRLIRTCHELRDRSRMLLEKTGARMHQAMSVLERSSTARRRAKNRAHDRFETTAPPLAPPALHCPSCDCVLAYERSHIGGVNGREREQWDYYACPSGCGKFQHRQRTRKLRPV